MVAGGFAAGLAGLRDRVDQHHELAVPRSAEPGTDLGGVCDLRGTWGGVGNAVEVLVQGHRPSGPGRIGDPTEPLRGVVFIGARGWSETLAVRIVTNENGAQGIPDAPFFVFNVVSAGAALRVEPAIISHLKPPIADFGKASGAQKVCEAA